MRYKVSAAGTLFSGQSPCKPLGKRQSSLYSLLFHKQSLKRVNLGFSKWGIFFAFHVIAFMKIFSLKYIYTGISNISGIFWIILHYLGCSQLIWDCQKSVWAWYGLERNWPFSKASNSDADNFFPLCFMISLWQRMNWKTMQKVKLKRIEKK